MTELADPTENRKTNPDWHYHPALPISVSPLFTWPIRPKAVFSWYAKSWLRPSSLLIWLAMAVSIWLWATPGLAEMKQFSWLWVLQVYARNLLTLALIGGGLHLFLYTAGLQGNQRRFDDRPTPKNQKKFTFNSQKLDNLFWSFGSGVLFWTGYEVLYFWSLANGYVPGVTWSENPVWFIALFLIIPTWSSMHFYFVHRALHSKQLYKRVHALHHRNVNIMPFAGISMHPFEHLLYFNSVILHFLLPSHPVHFLFHILIQALNPLCSHSGYEGVVVRDRNRLALGDFFHQLHHRYFECNYGTAEMPWDKWFGTFHDGTPEKTAQARDRMRKLSL